MSAALAMMPAPAFGGCASEAGRGSRLAAAVAALSLHALALYASTWAFEETQAPPPATISARLLTIAPAPQPASAAPSVAQPRSARPQQRTIEKRQPERAPIARARRDAPPDAPPAAPAATAAAEPAPTAPSAPETETSDAPAAPMPAAAAPTSREAGSAAASSAYLPIAKQAPDYPERALDAGIEGDCTVEYAVTPEGRVANPQVAGACHPLFIRPSLEAARGFRYRPRIVDGRAVTAPAVRNTFHYRIERRQVQPD